MTPQLPHSRTYKLQERAFRTALKHHGVRIRAAGDAWRGLLCITGAIERARHNDVAGILGRANTPVEMLAEDFAKLGPIVANITTVEIACEAQSIRTPRSSFRNGQSGFLSFTVFSPTYDDADPVVRFTAIITGGVAVDDTPAPVDMPSPATEERVDVPIPAGQTVVPVVFKTRKLSSDYFVDAKVETIRGTVIQDIRAYVQPNSPTQTGFTVELSAAPPDANCVLRVRVKI